MRTTSIYIWRAGFGSHAGLSYPSLLSAFGCRSAPLVSSRLPPLFFFSSLLLEAAALSLCRPLSTAHAAEPGHDRGLQLLTITAAVTVGSRSWPQIVAGHGMAHNMARQTRAKRDGKLDRTT